MARERHGLDQEKVVELEFDLPRIVLIVVLLSVAGVGAFFLGRMSLSGQGAVGPGTPPAQESVAVEGGFAPGSGSVFDQVGEDAAPRSLGRQVTRELSLGGRYEIDLGVVPSRVQAQALLAKAETAGVPAVIVGASGGSYRVAGGPFSTQSQARRASARLAEILGREVPVVGNNP